MKREIQNMTTLERQKKSIKNSILLHCFCSFIILAIGVATYIVGMYHYDVDVDLIVFALALLFVLFFEYFISAIRLFKVIMVYKKANVDYDEIKIVDRCKQVVFLSRQTIHGYNIIRGHSDVVCIKFIDANGQKFYFVLPWAFGNYKSRRLEIKQKYLNKTFKIECYGGSNAVKMIKGFEKPLYH